MNGIKIKIKIYKMGKSARKEAKAAKKRLRILRSFEGYYEGNAMVSPEGPPSPEAPDAIVLEAFPVNVSFWFKLIDSSIHPAGMSAMGKFIHKDLTNGFDFVGGFTMVWLDKEKKFKLDLVLYTNDKTITSFGASSYHGDESFGYHLSSVHSCKTSASESPGFTAHGKVDKKCICGKFDGVTCENATDKFISTYMGIWKRPVCDDIEITDDHTDGHTEFFVVPWDDANPASRNESGTIWTSTPSHVTKHGTILHYKVHVQGKELLDLPTYIKELRLYRSEDGVYTRVKTYYVNGGRNQTIFHQEEPTTLGWYKLSAKVSYGDRKGDWKEGDYIPGDISIQKWKKEP